jgi:hypothetical protein
LTDSRISINHFALETGTVRGKSGDAGVKPPDAAVVWAYLATFLATAVIRVDFVGRVGRFVSPLGFPSRLCDERGHGWRRTCGLRLFHYCCCGSTPRALRSPILIEREHDWRSRVLVRSYHPPPNVPECRFGTDAVRAAQADVVVGSRAPGNRIGKRPIRRPGGPGVFAVFVHLPLIYLTKTGMTQLTCKGQELRMCFFPDASTGGKGLFTR